jgi:transcriptional regulator GlxA family with amidase domain
MLSSTTKSLPATAIAARTGTHRLSPDVAPDLIKSLLKAIVAVWNLEEKAAETCVDLAIEVIHQESAKRSYAENLTSTYVGGLAPWQARTVTRHIRDNVDMNIPLETLAGLANLSCSQFRRAFKTSFGDAPHAYIMRQRILRAQELMLSTRRPLSELALSCGFADQSHFTRLFVRLVGETPNNWRRSRLLR